MIYLGADHGGFELKEKLKAWFTKSKLPYIDLGAYKLDPADDYPQYAFAVAETVVHEDDSSKPFKDRPQGILICRSAVGVVIAANKVPGIRAVAAYDVKCANHSRYNDDTNVLGLSGDWLNQHQAEEIIKAWLKTEFSHAPRHVRRIGQIAEKEIGKLT